MSKLGLQVNASNTTGLGPRETNGYTSIVRADFDPLGLNRLFHAFLKSRPGALHTSCHRARAMYCSLPGAHAGMHAYRLQITMFTDRCLQSDAVTRSVCRVIRLGSTRRRRSYSMTGRTAPPRTPTRPRWRATRWWSTWDDASLAGGQPSALPTTMAHAKNTPKTQKKNARHEWLLLLPMGRPLYNIRTCR